MVGAHPSESGAMSAPSRAPSTPSNADPAELARFGGLAASWWDPNGPSRALHDLNPARLGYVRERARLGDAALLDVGCGGGLLAEAMAREGARVTAIDLAPEVIDVAAAHAREAGIAVDYRVAAIEDLARSEPNAFAAITCMEVLEHVPDPEAVLDACHAALVPGGQLFVSTLNRTPEAFALAIVGAEYIARLIPRGTHRYETFIRPSELAAMLRGVGFSVVDVSGLRYNPLTRRAWVDRDPRVNYLVHAIRRP